MKLTLDATIIDAVALHLDLLQHPTLSDVELTVSKSGNVLRVETSRALTDSEVDWFHQPRAPQQVVDTTKQQAMALARQVRDETDRADVRALARVCLLLLREDPDGQ